MLELKILTPQEKFLSTVEFNYDELKNNLTLGLQKFEGILLTEDTYKECKDIRAKLNALYKALDDKRKEIKKKCLEPYEKFEKDIMELMNLVKDKALTSLDNQVKSYDNNLKEIKRQEIINYFNSKSFFGDLIKIEHPCFWDEKWLNATKKMKDVEFEIDNKITTIKEGLETIDLTFKDSEFKPQMRDVFLKTLDIRNALNEKTRLENQKKAEEEYKRKQEELAKQKAEEQKKVEPIVEVVKEEVKQEVQQQEVKKWKEFLVEVNKDQFDMIRDFLKSNNINYKVKI